MSETLPRLRVAMLCDNAFVSDKRILREAYAVAEAGCDITVFAVRRHDLPDQETVDGVRVRRIFDENKIFDVKEGAYLRRMASVIAQHKPQVLHCHDWVMLNVGANVKRIHPKTFLIYDSHEQFHSWPIHYSSRSPYIMLKSAIARYWLIARERRDARFIDRLITVSQSIADDLEKHFQLKHKPAIVRNFAELEPITQHDDFVRRDLNIPKTDKVLVLFSNYIYRKQRNIETVIDQFANQPGIALVIFCGNGGHKDYFVQNVKQRGINNVYFHDVIAPSRIVNYLASCDVGLVSTWNKKHLSYWNGLENKLFHYVMSELPILASAQPEHRRIVETYDLGVCVSGDEPNAYTEGLKKIWDNYDRYKANVIKAKPQLSWDKEKQSLFNLYDEVARVVSHQGATR